MDAFDEWQEVGVNAFKTLEDGLVEFTTTAKLNFKDLANSIIQDITRIVIRQNITGPLAAGLHSLLPSLFGVLGNTGGTINLNNPNPDPLAYPGGPHAPFLGQAAGGIVGPGAPNIQIINKSSQPLRADDKTTRFSLKDSVMQIVLEDTERNGPMTQALRTPKL